MNKQTNRNLTLGVFVCLLWATVAATPANAQTRFPKIDIFKKQPTADGAPVTDEERANRKAARRAAFTTGAAACGVAAGLSVLAKALGSKGADTDALANCVGTGLDAGFKAYEEQLKWAKQVAESKGVKSAVVKEKVAGDGKTKALDKLTLNLDPNKIAKSDKEVFIVVDQAVSIANDSKGRIDITLTANEDAVWISDWIEGKLIRDARGNVFRWIRTKSKTEASIVLEAK